LGISAASSIQVATIAGTIQVREWPATEQRRGDAFLVHGLFADAQSYTLLARRLAKGGLRVLAMRRARSQSSICCCWRRRDWARRSTPRSSTA